LFDSSLKKAQRHNIYVGIEISTKINSKNNLFISIVVLTIFIGYSLHLMERMKLGKYGNILDENEIFNLTYVIVLAST
jgi:hypothetical protein